ncbi:MAG: 3-hydroxyacyl-CoA dehydrogenase/enoyl-CoA hydratase family protein [Alphaproteobacteria bacterium]|nr:3-hydroxyacyl-CoA dehydrogenase/enoyl-CoA hydratase family protein [Rhodospirillales bacterium]MCW9045835.1 3-hydroxyacyl-CoA dehydrogenase/enoyl-CoA hydratase family protein [Alphaproteobacteria bacterium]
MTEINKVAVLGAGVMGAGIAAHVANAGLPVVLLDIVPDGAKDRNVVASGAIAQLLKTKPAPLTSKRNAKLITPGNLDDNMDMLSDCDLIIEVVIERLDIKQGLYKKIDAVRKKGSMVASNTSTIPLNQLVDSAPDGFADDFVIMHFFNPPRYMRLLEIVSGPKTRPEVTKAISEFGDVKLGKGVVHCKDTPGFIGNRVGNLWGVAAARFAFEEGLTVEEADSIIGKPLGFPKTGIFGLADLVGIDLTPHVAASMLKSLPEKDMYRDLYQENELMTKMIADGYTGRKGKGGFYRINKESGKKVKETINLVTGEYAPTVKSTLASAKAGKKGIRAVVEYDDKGGRYAWKVLSHSLSYAASMVPEISDTIYQVDEALKDGYAWKWGPFEMIDKLGAAWFAEKLAAEGMEVPELLKTVGDGTFYRVENNKVQFMETDGSYSDLPRGEGVLLLSDIKLASEPVSKNGSASLWDIGDGVICLEFHTKMNSLDDGIVAQMKKATKLIEKGDFKALVIHNEGENFSVGANVGLALFAANLGLWPVVESAMSDGQKTLKKLKYSKFPVVSAPRGMALGGGCEVLLHSDAVQAHVETYTGLVEVGVGVIPGWGGCKEMITRHTLNKRRPGGPMSAMMGAFEMISTAQVATSAAEAKEKLIMREGDGITMNRDRLLADAKAKALALLDGYTPPEEVEISLPGPTALTAVNLAVEGFVANGMAKPHDATVSKALGRVLTGGDTDMTEVVTEDQLYALEREAFLGLLKTEKTLQRIEHMLTTGKPLRN